MDMPRHFTRLLQTAADCCLIAEGVELPCGIGVMLVEDEKIREINRDTRGIDKATDVLSFPTVNYKQGKTAGQSQALLKKEFDGERGVCMLGDVVLSVDHIRSQADEYGHSVEREAAYLLVHGVCHLMGYDHGSPEEQKVMRAMEEKALNMMGMGRDGQGEGVSDETLLHLARKAMERSYAPYSKFAVGACLLAADGRVFQGCNVENASFGLTNCAERTALFTAVSEGATEFTAIAIAARDAAPWPCGACRQVLNEFAPNIRVLVTWGDGKTACAPLGELLPHGFGPQDLNPEK
jgi:cytidine deaminase